MDFMKCIWRKRVAYVTLTPPPPEDATLEDIKPMIEKIRSRSDDMFITIDLSDSYLLDTESIQTMIQLVIDVIGYTKDDNLLRKIEFVDAGYMFRLIYRPISRTFPKYIRDMFVFV